MPIQHINQGYSADNFKLALLSVGNIFTLFSLMG